MRIPLRVRGEKQKEPKVQTNPELIRKIQPHFGIAFTDEKYIKLGDGYEACIYIYGFKRYIREFWLSNIMNINSAVVVLELSPPHAARVAPMTIASIIAILFFSI